MKLRCASCGWTDEVVHAGGKGFDLARHLAVCPTRDEARLVPRWSIYDNVLEGAWTSLDHGANWKRFTERAFAPSDGSRHNG